MQFARPIVAAGAAPFGRGRRWQLDAAPSARANGIGPDLKLFATTFVAGFLFVSIVIG